MARDQAGTTLVLCAHDPDRRYLEALEERRSGFARYAAVVVGVTDPTHPDLTRALESAGVTVVPGRAGEPGVSQRAALAVASKDVPGSEFLCCDLDRWLHWQGRFPEELAGIPGRVAALRPRPWYVCLGRTARAFATHPPVQRAAESATNQALSAAAGRRLDATAGAWWLSSEGVDLILAGSIERTKATDLEWPGLVLRADRRRLRGIATEGLEFETSEFYRREIAAAGGEPAWLAATYGHPRMWRDRLRLAADSVDALARVIADPAP